MAATGAGIEPQFGTRASIGSLTAPTLAGVLILGLWVVLSASTGQAMVPGPAALVDRLVIEIAAGGLMRAAGATLWVSLVGCLVGTAVALPLGYAMAHSRVIAAALWPYVTATQAIPAVAVAPLLAVWFGYDTFPRALLCALLVFFPILLGTVLGLGTIDRDVVDAARVDGAGPWWLLARIETPLALPAVLTGLRNGFVLSVTGAVVGEFVMGGQGLGELLGVYRSRSDTVGMVATLVALAVIAIVISMAVRGLERWVRWW